MIELDEGIHPDEVMKAFREGKRVVSSDGGQWEEETELKMIALCIAKGRALAIVKEVPPEWDYYYSPTQEVICIEAKTMSLHKYRYLHKTFKGRPFTIKAKHGSSHGCYFDDMVLVGSGDDSDVKYRRDESPPQLATTTFDNSQLNSFYSVGNQFIGEITNLRIKEQQPMGDFLTTSSSGIDDSDSDSDNSHSWIGGGYYWVEFDGDEDDSVCMIMDGELYVPSGGSSGIPLDKLEEHGVSRICERVER